MSLLFLIPGFFLLSGTANDQLYSEGRPLNQPESIIELEYYTIPSDLQFFGRDSQDSSEVIVEGRICSPGYDSVFVEVYVGGGLLNHYADALKYVAGEADFSLAPRIYADTVSFDLSIGFVKQESIQINRIVKNLVCGDVIIVHGQSNAWAEDYDSLAHFKSNWIRTLGRTAWYNKPVPSDINDTSWYIAQGHTSNTTAAIGVYAMELGRLLVENYAIPICIFNGSGGGGPISYYQRNEKDPLDLNTVYGRLLYRVTKAELTRHIKIITWNQGESETDTGYLHYASNFHNLYTSLLEDFPNVEKTYIFQIPPGCISNTNANRLREVQRLIPGSYKHVEIMSRCGLPGHHLDDCHYHFSGYSSKAYWSYRQISRDLYGANWDYQVNPPMILQCGYINQHEIAMVFDQPVEVSRDTMVQQFPYSLKDHIYLDGQWGVIDTIRYRGDTVLLKTNTTSQFSRISYTPNKFYNNTSVVYDGPWIIGADSKVGALTFFQFPVINLTKVIVDPSMINSTE